MRVVLTPWQQFYQRWQGCTDCELHKVRRHVVLARGNVPADVVFCGEAPGPSENKLGQPFIGPAGHLLDKIIATAEQRSKVVSKAFTNLIACFPKDETDGNKFTEPPAASIKACSQRLLEFLDLCKPKLIVCVGKLAAKYKPFDAYDTVAIIHPAAVLRMQKEQPHRVPVEIKRTEIILADAFSNV
jgi:uracil-DNA glycosylase family 4